MPKGIPRIIIDKVSLKVSPISIDRHWVNQKFHPHLGFLQVTMFLFMNHFPKGVGSKPTWESLSLYNLGID